MLSLQQEKPLTGPEPAGGAAATVKIDSVRRAEPNLDNLVLPAIETQEDKRVIPARGERGPLTVKSAAASLGRRVLYGVFSFLRDSHSYLNSSAIKDLEENNSGLLRAALNYLYQGDTVNSDLSPALPVIEKRANDPLFRRLAPFILQLIAKGVLASPPEKKEKWAKASLPFLDDRPRSIEALSRILRYSSLEDKNWDLEKTLASFLGAHADRTTIRNLAFKVSQRVYFSGIEVEAPNMSLLIDLKAPERCCYPAQSRKAVLWLAKEKRLPHYVLTYHSAVPSIAKDILDTCFREKGSPKASFEEARKVLTPGSPDWLNEHSARAHKAAANIVLLLSSKDFAQEMTALLKDGAVKSDLIEMAAYYMCETDTRPAAELLDAIESAFAKPQGDRTVLEEWLETVSTLGPLAERLLPQVVEIYRNCTDDDTKLKCFSAFNSIGRPCAEMIPALCEELDSGKWAAPTSLCAALGAVASGSRNERAKNVLTLHLFSYDDRVKNTARMAIKEIDAES